MGEKALNKTQYHIIKMIRRLNESFADFVICDVRCAVTEKSFSYLHPGKWNNFLLSNFNEEIRKLQINFAIKNANAFAFDPVNKKNAIHDVKWAKLCWWCSMNVDDDGGKWCFFAIFCQIIKLWVSVLNWLFIYVMSERSSGRFFISFVLWFAVQAAHALKWWTKPNEVHS